MEKAGLKDSTWHCNRHSVASRLVMAGVDIRTVAQLLVHATIQLNHLSPSKQLVTKSVTRQEEQESASIKLLTQGLRKWRNWQTHQT
jgi:site-specific recombinase XerD